MKRRFTLSRPHREFRLSFARRGPLTSGVLYQDSEPVAHANSLCSPKDTYSPLKGRKIVVSRILKTMWRRASTREKIWEQLLDE